MKYSFTQFNYNNVRLKKDYNLFQLGGLCIFLPLLEMILNINDNTQIFKNFMEFISNLIENKINREDNIDDYFQYYNEKFFPMLSLLLEQFKNNNLMSESVYINFFLVLNPLLTSYRDKKNSFSFESFIEWLTFNYKITKHFDLETQKTINDYMKQLFSKDFNFLLNKHVIYSFFHELSKDSNSNKKFDFRDVLFYIIDGKHTDNKTKIYIMHLIKEKNTPDNIIKNILEPFIKHFNYDINSVIKNNKKNDNKNDKKNDNKNEKKKDRNEDIVKSILVRLDLLKILINVDFLKDLRMLFRKKDLGIKSKIIRLIYIMYFSYSSLLEIKYIQTKKLTIKDYKNFSQNSSKLEFFAQRTSSIESNDNDQTYLKEFRHSFRIPRVDINKMIKRKELNLSENEDEINTDKKHNSNDFSNEYEIYEFDDDDPFNQTDYYINEIYNNLNNNVKDNIIRNFSVMPDIEVNEYNSFKILSDWFYCVGKFNKWEKSGIIITPSFIEDLYFDYCNSVVEMKSIIQILETIINLNNNSFIKIIDKQKFLLFYSKIYFENFKIHSNIESIIKSFTKKELDTMDNLLTNILDKILTKKNYDDNIKGLFLYIIIYIIKDSDNLQEKINDILDFFIALIKATNVYFEKKKFREQIFFYYIISYYSLLFINSNIINNYTLLEKNYLSKLFVYILNSFMSKLIDKKKFENQNHLQNNKITFYESDSLKLMIKKEEKAKRNITNCCNLLFYSGEKEGIDFIKIISITIQKLIRLIQKIKNYSNEIKDFYHNLLKNYENLIILLLFLINKNDDKKNNLLLEEALIFNFHSLNKNLEEEEDNEIIETYKLFYGNIINVLLPLLKKHFENVKTNKFICFKKLFENQQKDKNRISEISFSYQNQKTFYKDFYGLNDNAFDFEIQFVKGEINNIFMSEDRFKNYDNEKTLDNNIKQLYDDFLLLIEPPKESFLIYKKNIEKKYSKLFDEGFSEKIILDYSRIEQDYYLNLFQNNKDYRKLKKELFSFNNFYSNFDYFYKQRDKKIKFQNKYYLTNNLTLPLLSPIIGYKYYTPKFSKLKKEKKIFKEEEYYDIPINNYLDLDPFYCPIYYKDGFDCCIVKLLYHIRGKLIIENEYIEFYSVSLNEEQTKNFENFDNDKERCIGAMFKTHKDSLYYLKIFFNDIKFIFNRKYIFEDNALEIFYKNNKSYYIVFQDLKKKKDFYEKIISLKKKNLIYQKHIPLIFYNKDMKKIPKNPSEIIKLWNEREISNFEFLMWVNLFGNRSYRDIYQYPIFPWILEDLSIEKNNELNMDYIKYLEQNKSNPHILRDLSMPLGMLFSNEKAKRRREQYIINFKSSIDDLNNKYAINIIQKNENREPNSNLKIPLYNIEIEKLYSNKIIPLNDIPYYFGSHYSNPAYICHYLLRIFPYSFGAIEIQGDGFDAPDRLFINIERCFISVSSEKSDVRETIPQFFYFPEMFININNFYFGYLQNSHNIINSTVFTILNLRNILNEDERKNHLVEVPDVLLPYWSQNNPFIFTSLYREILEEKFIYLNKWIDMIFGEKQRGEKAQKIGNIYMAYSYDGVLLSKELKGNERKLNMKLSDYGICATQVFHEKVDEKKSESKKKIYFNENKNNLTISFPNYVKKGMIYSENKNFLNKIVPKEDKIELMEKIKCLPFKNYVAYNFGEKFENLIVGGFYSEVYLFINLNNSKTEIIEIKKSNPDLNYKDNSSVTCIEIDEIENLAFLGTELGNIIIYEIDMKNELDNIFNFKTIICYHTKRINYINSNSNLQLFIDCSCDGFINIYTITNFTLINSIHIFPHEFFVDIVILSSFPLPSFLIYSKEKKNFKSYTINGNKIYDEDIDIIDNLNINDSEDIILKDQIEYFYSREKNENIEKVSNLSPYVFIDGDFKEYLLYNTKCGLQFRKFPFLEKIEINRRESTIQSN